MFSVLVSMFLGIFLFFLIKLTGAIRKKCSIGKVDLFGWFFHYYFWEGIASIIIVVLFLYTDSVFCVMGFTITLSIALLVDSAITRRKLKKQYKEEFKEELEEILKGEVKECS